MTTIASIIAARDAFAAKVAAINTAISNLYADGVAFDHMIDHDSRMVAVSVSACHVGHWSRGWDDATSARVDRVRAAMSAVGLRHYDTGNATAGIRLIYRA